MRNVRKIAPHERDTKANILYLLNHAVGFLRKASVSSEGFNKEPSAGRGWKMCLQIMPKTQDGCPSVLQQSGAGANQIY